jgi:hypothetical protein
MTDPKEVSSFSIKRKECAKCGAVWLDDQHMWTGTGNKGNEMDLAGLVCNSISKEDPDYTTCINPKRGEIGGQTWAYRRGYIDGALKSKRDSLDELNGIINS